MVGFSKNTNTRKSPRTPRDADDFTLYGKRASSDFLSENSIEDSFETENTIISEDVDQTLGAKVIMHVFTANCGLSTPESVDSFIKNSLLIAKKEAAFSPWIKEHFKRDSKIDEIIDHAGVSIQNSFDVIESQNIVNPGRVRSVEFE